MGEGQGLFHRNGAGCRVKAGAILAALKEEFGLGHGHAMAIVALLKSAKQERGKR